MCKNKKKNKKKGVCVFSILGHWAHSCSDFNKSWKPLPQNKKKRSGIYIRKCLPYIVDLWLRPCLFTCFLLACLLITRFLVSLLVFSLTRPPTFLFACLLAYLLDCLPTLMNFNLCLITGLFFTFSLF